MVYKAGIVLESCRNNCPVRLNLQLIVGQYFLFEMLKWTRHNKKTEKQLLGNPGAEGEGCRETSGLFLKLPYVTSLEVVIRVLQPIKFHVRSMANRGHA